MLGSTHGLARPRSAGEIVKLDLRVARVDRAQRAIFFMLGQVLHFGYSRFGALRTQSGVHTPHRQISGLGANGSNFIQKFLGAVEPLGAFGSRFETGQMSVFVVQFTLSGLGGSGGKLPLVENNDPENLYGLVIRRLHLTDATSHRGLQGELAGDSQHANLDRCQRGANAQEVDDSRASPPRQCRCCGQGGIFGRAHETSVKRQSLSSWLACRKYAACASSHISKFRDFRFCLRSRNDLYSVVVRTTHSHAAADVANGLRATIEGDSNKNPAAVLRIERD